MHYLDSKTGVASGRRSQYGYFLGVEVVEFLDAIHIHIWRDPNDFEAPSPARFEIGEEDDSISIKGIDAKERALSAEDTEHFLFIVQDALEDIYPRIERSFRNHSEWKRSDVVRLADMIRDAYEKAIAIEPDEQTCVMIKHLANDVTTSLSGRKISVFDNDESGYGLSAIKTFAGDDIVLMQSWGDSQHQPPNGISRHQVLDPIGFRVSDFAVGRFLSRSKREPNIAAFKESLDCYLDVLIYLAKQEPKWTDDDVHALELYRDVVNEAVRSSQPIDITKIRDHRIGSSRIDPPDLSIYQVKKF
jgi:hypothetical protein